MLSSVRYKIVTFLRFVRVLVNHMIASSSLRMFPLSLECHRRGRSSRRRGGRLAGAAGGGSLRMVGGGRGGGLRVRVSGFRALGLPSQTNLERRRRSGEPEDRRQRRFGQRRRRGGAIAPPAGRGRTVVGR
jgi:hypothetical protein